MLHRTAALSRALFTVLFTLFLMGAAQAGDLVVPGVHPKRSSLTAGDSTSVNMVIRNLGTSKSGKFKSRLVLSGDAKITAQDYALGKDFEMTIKAGETKDHKMTVTFPKGLATGTYYLGVVAYETGRDVRAAGLFRRALKIWEQSGVGDPQLVGQARRIVERFEASEGSNLPPVGSGPADP